MWIRYEQDDGSHNWSWEAGVIEGFNILREAGKSHPLMEKLEDLVDENAKSRVALPPME